MQSFEASTDMIVLPPELRRGAAAGTVQEPTSWPETAEEVRDRDSIVKAIKKRLSDDGVFWKASSQRRTQKELLNQYAWKWEPIHIHLNGLKIQIMNVAVIVVGGVGTRQTAQIQTICSIVILMQDVLKMNVYSIIVNNR